MQLNETGRMSETRLVDSDSEWVELVDSDSLDAMINPSPTHSLIHY